MRRPNATGTIETTPDGRFRGRLPRKHRRRYLPPCDRYAEAAADLAAYLEAHPAAEPDDLSVSAWGARWLTEREASGHYRSTRRDRRAWKKYVDGAAIGELSLRHVEPEHVRRWLADLRGRSGQTQGNALALLRGALRAAVDAGELRADPTAGVRIPRGARAQSGESWTWLRADEIVRVLERCSTARQRAVVTTAIFTGLRAGELWALTWDAIDVGRRVVRVVHGVTEDRRLGPPKSGRPREIPLLAPVALAIEAWRASEENARRSHLGLVWPARDGGPHGSGFQAEWQPLAARAELGRRVRFHDLRHTCASHLIQGTWAPSIVARPLRLEEVQLWLGHSTRVMTERYAHLAPDSLSSTAVAYDWPTTPESPRESVASPAGFERAVDLRLLLGMSPDSAPIGQSVGQLARELLAAVEARDPYAIHRAIDLAEAVLTGSTAPALSADAVSPRARLRRSGGSDPSA